MLIITMQTVAALNINAYLAKKHRIYKLKECRLIQSPDEQDTHVNYTAVMIEHTIPARSTIL